MYGRAPDAPGRADSEDERGAIGENFCQPPPLLLPRSRALAEPPELPNLGADAEFELPRASESLSGLFPGLWLERWIPLFERTFEPALERTSERVLALPFPGLATSRLFPIALLFAALVAPRDEKKC